MCERGWWRDLLTFASRGAGMCLLLRGESSLDELREEADKKKGGVTPKRFSDPGQLGPGGTAAGAATTLARFAVAGDCNLANNPFLVRFR